MRILGIDPGSRCLGYAVVDCQGRELKYVECGVLEVKATDSIESRLAELLAGLGEIVAELAPEQAAVEEIFTAINARSALALGQARGVVLAACGRAGVPVFGYPPATVKQAVTGQGRAPKLQVAHMVKTLLGLRREPRADAADALAVAVAHAHIRKDLRAWSSGRRRA